MDTLRKNGSLIELNYITFLMSSDDKVIKKNVKAKIVCDLNDIKVIDTYYNIHGVEESTKCKVYHETLGWLVLNEPYNKMQHLKMPGSFTISGFQRKKERLKTKKITDQYGFNYKRIT